MSVSFFDTGDIIVYEPNVTTFGKTENVSGVGVIIGYSNDLRKLNTMDYIENKDFYISNCVKCTKLVIQHITYIDNNEAYSEINKEYISKCLEVKRKDNLNPNDIDERLSYGSIEQKIGYLDDYNKYVIVSKMADNILISLKYKSLKDILSIIETQYKTLRVTSKISIYDLRLEDEIKLGRLYLIKKKLTYDIVCCIGITDKDEFVFVTILKDYDYDTFKIKYASLSVKIDSERFIEQCLRNVLGKTRMISLSKTKLYDLNLTITKRQYEFNYRYAWKFTFHKSILK